MTAGTTYVASYFTPSRYAVNSALLRERRHHPRAADRAARTAPTAANGAVPVRQHRRRLPEQQLQQRELLGRRRLRRRAPGHARAGGRRPVAGAGATGVAAGTQVDRDLQRGRPARVRHLDGAPRRRQRPGPGDDRPTTRPTPRVTLTPTSALANSTTYTRRASAARRTQRQHDVPRQLERSRPPRRRRRRPTRAQAGRSRWSRSSTEPDVDVPGGDPARRGAERVPQHHDRAA